MHDKPLCLARIYSVLFRTPSSEVTEWTSTELSHVRTWVMIWDSFPITWGPKLFSGGFKTASWLKREYPRNETIHKWKTARKLQSVSKTTYFAWFYRSI